MKTKEELIEIENEIRKLFLEKKIRYMFHMSGGNEEELIKIFQDIKEDDWVFSTHRCHYHALLKGIEKNKFLRYIQEGKSMHMYDKKRKFFTSSIVGGVLPIAVGVALGIKLSNKSNRVWVFVGDMCKEMGIFHECYKYASRHNLPITFVVEDNGRGIMNTKKVWGEEKNYLTKLIEYKYEHTYPHAGTGDFVKFDD